MTLISKVYESSIETRVETYEQAKSLQANLVWKKLDEISIGEAIAYWLPTLQQKTRLNYQSGMKKLFELGLLDPLMTLQAFALINHEALVDRIKLVHEWSECTRQARAACYISFTNFLSRRLQGVVRKAMPSREGSAKTFFKVREKVKTSAMTHAQWIAFFSELEKINPRDCLIAKMILQGGKRVQEVLALQTHQIDWDQCEVTFLQSKMRGLLKETVITYPESYMQKLKEYVGERRGVVFVTRSEKPVMINQLASSFSRAGLQGNIPFKITPHVLRASAVTYFKQQGFDDSDIMKVTGHSSAEMIYAYDKSSPADNASKLVQLIS
jgi:integrase